jgi:hypothetical protein
MISVELNTALKDHFQTVGEPYSSIPIFPLSAYADTKAPFILYYEYSGTQNEEQFFLGVSNVVYYIYDTDISRMKDIGYVLGKFFNVADDIDPIKEALSMSTEYGDLRYRLTGSRLVAGSVIPPIEIEGLAVQTLNFRVTYLYAS